MRILVLVAFTACARNARPDCSSISGLESVAKPGTLVIFGELHGTSEIPRFIGDAACAASRSARVHVGLELPAQDGPLLEAFLSGDDQAFQRSSFWTKPYQDGRSTSAMLALLRNLRALHVGVFFFDDAAVVESHARDAAMANNISKERARAPGDLYLIEVGDYHARRVPGAPFDLAMPWMASLLARRESALFSLDVRYLPGSAWTCQMFQGGEQSCGPTQLHGTATSAMRAIELTPLPEGYDGTFAVGTITATLPAFVSPGRVP